MRLLFSFCLLLLVLVGCESNQAIVNGIDEREANVIVVFLESKGIQATKVRASGGGNEMAGGQQTGPQFNIVVPDNQAVNAMSYLNRNGLPRRQGKSLLELFAQQGLMSTDKQETIRYQAGLAEEINSTIMMMDGVIESSVQLSFPTEENTPGVQKTQRITAAVYVKHQGIGDDPQSHLENKVKRLVAGSISGLDINDVTVVSDRSRLTEVLPFATAEAANSLGNKEYVKIWSMTMSKESASSFRFLFSLLLLGFVLFTALAAWLIWKVYPFIKKGGGVKQLLSPVPFSAVEKPPEES